MRLIDADALIGALHNVTFEDGTDREIVYRFIELAPTVEERKTAQGAKKCAEGMTNEKAIQRLKEGAPFSGLYVEEWEEALNMAIEALRHQNITQAVIKVGFSEEDKKQLVKEIVENLKHEKVICNPKEYEQDATEAAETHDFREGELIVYVKGTTAQIGEIKRICDDGAFVWYHEGDTASKTPFENMHKLQNAYCIKQTSFALDRPRCGSCRHFSECTAATDIEATTSASDCGLYEMIIRRTEP